MPSLSRLGPGPLSTAARQGQPQTSARTVNAVTCLGWPNELRARTGAAIIGTCPTGNHASFVPGLASRDVPLLGLQLPYTPPLAVSAVLASLAKEVFKMLDVAGEPMNRGSVYRRNGCLGRSSDG